MKTAKLRDVDGNEIGILTTDHAASSYGIPVLVIDGQPYGISDTLPDGRVVREVEFEQPTDPDHLFYRWRRAWNGLLS